jgi:hypothetical protein
MSIIEESLEYVYCSNFVSNHALIRLIRFVLQFTIHLCNAIYFLIIFSTLQAIYKNFIFYVFGFKHGQRHLNPPSRSCCMRYMSPSHWVTCLLASSQHMSFRSCWVSNGSNISSPLSRAIMFFSFRKGDQWLDVRTTPWSTKHRAYGQAPC